MKEYKIVWIGAVADKKYLDYMSGKGNRQSTAYNVQGKFVKGLKSLGIKVDTLSGHVMPAYPQYREMKIPERFWGDENEVNIDASFINLPLINIFSKGNGLIKSSKKVEIRKGDVLLIYSLHSPFLRAASYIKKKKKCTAIAIIPDLPEYMNSRQSLVRKLLKKIDRRLIDKNLANVDGYVLFAENMKKSLPLKNKYITIEGIVDFDEKRYRERVENAHDLKKIVMLSGSLNLSEGIERLLDIFGSVKDTESELWITGFGDGEKLIKDRAKNDKRIKYWGYIDEYDKLLELQRQAKVLVAMVEPKNPKSEVFFPSKIMEYLMTGKEVICYKLGGIPKEYDTYVKYFDYKSIEKSAKLLEDTLNLDIAEIRRDGIERIELLRRKDSVSQARVLQRFIDEVKK